MKWQGWGVRWEYEKSGEIAVFAVDEVVGSLKPRVIKELRRVLGEFSITLEIVDGSVNHGGDLLEIKGLLSSSMTGNKIDFDRFERQLSNFRREGRLSYGIVILIDKDSYEFHQPAGQQPAIYGIGVPSGLVVLRYTHIEAVRHEFGHVLGLGRHHSGCVMNYECNPGTIGTFCRHCRQQIEEMWHGS